MSSTASSFLSSTSSAAALPPLTPGVGGGPSPLCFKCNTPLILDASIAHLDASSYSFLAHTGIGTDRGTAPGHLHRGEPFPMGGAVAGGRARPSESFVVLTRQHGHPRTIPENGSAVHRDLPSSGSGTASPHPHPQGHPPPHPILLPALTSAQTFEPSSIPSQPNNPVRGSISQRLFAIARTTDIAMGTAEPSGPVCRECADLILDVMARRLAEMGTEKARYAEFIRQAQQPPSPHDPIQSSLQDLEDEETALTEATRACEAQLKTLAAQWDDAERERAEVDALEARYWGEVRSVEEEIHALRAESDSLERRLAIEERSLRSLESSNVYDEAFHIDLDPSASSIATINSLRLGRLPTEHVEWAEVNAAWGQVALLLHVLARRLSAPLRTYAIHPLGPLSYIERLSDGAKLELYVSADIPLGLYFLNPRYDPAQEGALDCLRQLCEHVARAELSWSYPHVITKDHIGDVSIRLPFKGEEQWTRALHRVLRNLKSLLSYVSSKEKASSNALNSGA